MSRKMLSSIDNLSRRGFVQATVAAGVGSVIPSTGFAQANYPTRQVRIVSGAAAGGPTDFMARAAARSLQDALGKPVVVENQTGASGNIAAQAVARAEPDGYTLLAALAPLAQNMAIFKDPGFDMQKDFVPLSLMAGTDLLIVANKDRPYSNLKELMAHVKKTGIPVNCGVQSPPQIQYLKKVTGIDITIIPYRGSALTMTDVIGGKIDIGLSPYGDAVPHIKAGTIKPLFCLGEKRARYLPDLETVGETFPGFGFTSWYGLVAPARVPADIVKRLRTDLVRIAKSDTYKSAIETVGLAPIDAPEQFDAVIAREVEQWKKIVAELNLPRI
ncbi:MAG TPA: tripartite tricarboxylate transporter substrate-binding protein [Pseudolabrys sp.]|nr:tripartite tricarboxylate transporter substrate-binding protein [Pseudolabrys sp.]